MDSNIAIKVKNLTKIYHLYDKPQDRLKEALNPFKKSYHHDFYSVNDVSFEIKKGETVGIIGKNGAGKSTLLKMITGVLTQTSGSIETSGKIASLLELGAGFNPEMAGLENIYLNGTLMGFSKEEMDSKIDAILEFADIGEFIYQPVKMYSSGMFARLAFAVAINVDPDILIVDEVLSVGDIRFQQKSIRKMKDFIEQGKTILFVTHDMGTVSNFCTKVMWLSDGELQLYGETEGIIEKYLSNMVYGLETSKITKVDELSPVQQNNIEWECLSGCNSFGEKGTLITNVALYFNKENKKVAQLNGGETLSLYVKLNVLKTLYDPIIGINILDRYMNIIYSLNSLIDKVTLGKLSARKEYLIEIIFDFPKIKNDEYTFTIAIADGTQDSHLQQHWVNDVLSVIVNNQDKRYSQGILVSTESNYIIKKGE